MSSLLFFCSMIVRDIYHHVEQIKIFVVYDFLADFEDFVKIHDMRCCSWNSVNVLFQPLPN